MKIIKRIRFFYRWILFKVTMLRHGYDEDPRGCKIGAVLGTDGILRDVQGNVIGYECMTEPD